MPNRTIPKLNIKCDHKGKGLYWCPKCKPDVPAMSVWLCEAHREIDKLQAEIKRRDERDADGVR